MIAPAFSEYCTTSSTSHVCPAFVARTSGQRVIETLPGSELDLGSCRGLELGTSGAIYQRVKLPTLMRGRARPHGKLISPAILSLTFTCNVHSGRHPFKNQ